MDQYFYQWFYQQSKPTMQNHFKSIDWCWVTTTNLSIQSKAKTKCSSFSVIHYSESIHTYLHIWIIWYSNAFLIFVCFHISSFSFIQSIQIIMSLILFPESIIKMLSLIYDNSDISNNMIIIMSCFFPFWDENTHMNVSITVFIIFALSSIDKY